MATTKYEKVSTTKPKDLKIDVVTTITNVAKKMSFSASWSCGDDNYNAGQQFYYRWTGHETNPGAKGGKNWSDYSLVHATGHTSTTINKDLRTITFTERNFSSFYPETTQHLRWLRVYVRGQKGKYTKKVNKKDKHFDPQWSEYSERSLHILAPSKPTLSDPNDGGTDFTKTFDWAVNQQNSWIGDAKADMEKFEIFYDCQWESVLIDNNNSMDKYDPNSSYNPLHAGYRSGTTPEGDTSGTIQIQEANTGWSGNYSYTRYIRIRARGPGGDSSWVTSKHTYCLSPIPDNISASSTISKDAAGNYNATIGITTARDSVYPFKYHLIQHCIATPVTSVSGGKVTISCPPEDGGANWVDDVKIPPTYKEYAGQYGDSSGMEYRDAARIANANFKAALTNNNMYTFHVDSYQIEDKLVWGRDVVVGTDDVMTKGPASVITPYPGRLYAPSNIYLTDISTANFTLTVHATNNASDISASIMVIYYRTASNQGDAKIAGLIMHNEDHKSNVQLPNWTTNPIDIGVQAVLADYTETEIKNVYMASDIVWEGGSLPLPPANLNLESPRFGTILATWDWTWKEADSAEISWADHEDAWESTDQPNTFVMNNTNTGKWYIAGLGVGTWYVRVRFIRKTSEVETYGTYSTTEQLVMSSVPTVPYLHISPDIVRPDGEITLSWLYSSEDESVQKEVQIAKNSTRDTPIFKTMTGSSLTLSRSDLSSIGAWTVGQSIELVVRAKSEAGLLSGWSKPASFVVADLPAVPTLTFTQGWVSNMNIPVGDTTLVKDAVVSLPLQFSVTGVDTSSKISVFIERAEGNVVKRPDESEYPVFAGEVAYRNSNYRGTAIVTINQTDLIDYLDDNHDYNLRVVNTDSWGQTNEVIKPFRVRWNHQAVIPSATIEINRTDYISIITPTQPSSGYLAGDVCDIYRLSIDKPQLIVTDAAFGQRYVDVYPTIGTFGGYRVVYKTKFGDYRTDGGYAMTDYSEADEYIIDEFVSIINFGQDMVVLRYNLSMANTWKKDFIETKYLGGSVQGDWNPSVSRTGSLNATVTIQEDPLAENPESTIQAMRRLAVYSGICHVRTPDGSSYYANVDVQEDREEKWVTRIAKFTLTITRVDDPGTFEGLKYEDYMGDDED